MLKYTIVLGMISIVVFAAAPIHFIYKLIKNIMTVRLADRDGFSIVTYNVNRRQVLSGSPSYEEKTFVFQQ